MSKSIFSSKTVWVNVLSAAIELSGALHGVIAPGTLTIVVNVLNVLLRLVTKDAVHVMPPTPPRTEPKTDVTGRVIDGP